MRWACNRTSKDWNSPSFFVTPKSWQKPKSWQSSQFQCKQRIPPKKFLPKKFSKKIPPKKLRQKNSFKKILPKNSLKISKKKSKKFQKFSKNFKKNPKNSQIIPKILKISNSPHRTWRPKTLSGLFLKEIKFFSKQTTVAAHLRAAALMETQHFVFSFL